MADILTTTPTDKDLIRLSSLRPSILPSPPKVSSLLQKIIDLCSPKWISDFLFTSDPIHLQHFTSPTLYTNAVVAHITVTRISFEDNYHSAGKYIFVPAFSIDDITFGFGFMDGTDFRGRYFDIMVPANMPFRFLRISGSRQFLMVTEWKEAGVIIVYYSKKGSVLMTRNCAFTAVFSRNRLLKHMALNGGYIEMRVFLATLMHITEEISFRKCPFCGISGEVDCGCVSKLLVTPKHPFDLGHFKNNVVPNLGSFEGIGSRISADQSHIVQGIKVRSKVIEGISVISDMRRLVVTSYLKESQPSLGSVRLLTLGANKEDERENMEEQSSSLLINSGYRVSTESANLQLQWWEGERVARSPGDVADELEEEVKIHIAEERRQERNRQSARRSHLRYKWRRAEIDKELSKIRNQERQLRATEKSLREYNLSLRRKLGSLK